MNFLLRRTALAKLSTGPSKTVSTVLDEKFKSMTVTLSNPAKRNTLSFETLGQLQRALDEAKSHIKESRIKVRSSSTHRACSCGARGRFFPPATT